MEFKLLGPVEVRNRGSVMPMGGAKQRALLALLLLHANETVSRDRLIDELWGEVWTPSAGHRLETHISRLRKTLELNGKLVSDRGGYVLEVDPMLIDTHLFERLLEEGRREAAAGHTADAAQTLREALSLWRGGALADLAYEPFARSEIERLEELRVAAIEERVDLDLALGRHREVVAELDALTSRHPLRERLRGQLMLALYRSGRQAEALEAYQEFRRSLSEELGLEPGPVTKQLELSILNRDPVLNLAARGAASDAGGRVRAGAARRAVPVDRRRRSLALGAGVLFAVVLAGVVMAARGGHATQPAGIPGDSVGAISPSSGAIRAVVPLGTSPASLAVGDGAVWVANANAGTVSRIDPRTRAVVDTIPVGSSPSGIAVGPSAVWVTINGSGTVARIDPAVDRVVQTTPAGNAPTGVAVGPGAVWVANSSDGTVARIDALTGHVVKTIALGAGASEVAVGAGAVWVSDEAGNRVFRVDPHSDQATASINVGTGPSAIATGFGSVWVANSLDGTVSRIDPHTNTVTATIAVGDGAGGIAVGSGGVWVASQYAGTVSLISPTTNAVRRTIRVGNRPRGLALADGLVWVGASPADTGHRGGTLTVLTAFWPTTIDPVLTPVGTLLQLTDDGLTAYQRVGGSGSVQLVPDVAVSLPSPTDGSTTYTFQLRRGIRYSNGEPLRPEDFRRALERELILGPDNAYGGPFADVIGGAACASHPSRCDLSRGVVVDDAANTVTFRLVAPNPEFLERLTLPDAVAVPADTPLHDIGLHPLPTTGPYEFAKVSPPVGWLVRNPYFYEWSHAARPDGYPDRIVYRLIASPSAEIAPVERGSADYALDGAPPNRLTDLQTRFASQLHVNPSPDLDALVLNTRVAPFNDVRVRQAVSYAVDRAKIARLVTQGTRPTCQTLPPYLPGYERYCPYTLDPNPAGIWHAPNLARAERLIARSHTRGTPITLWNLGPYHLDYTPAVTYLVGLLDRLGYPTRIKDISTDINAYARFADSRAKAQAAIASFLPQYLSASQFIQVNFACQSYAPHSPGNANLSEFCNPQLDSQIQSALAAEANNSPDAAALWARADRTVTDQAAWVPLTTQSATDFVSSRVGNYQYSFQQGVLLDQLWVR